MKDKFEKQLDTAGNEQDVWIPHEIKCSECGKLSTPVKEKYCFVPNMCDECFAKGVIDMTTPEGYEKGMEAINNDPELSGKISVKSPYE